MGDELSFVYRDGVIESLEIHAATCSGDDGCSRSFEDKFKGQWAAWPTIAMEQGVYQFDGIFSSLTMVSGGFRWGDPDGACCVAVGAWAAQWTAPLPNTPGADAGSSGSGLNDGGSVRGRRRRRGLFGLPPSRASQRRHAHGRQRGHGVSSAGGP